MRRAHIWGWARTRRCDEPSNDLGPSSRHQSYPDCIIATHGYDFWEGQGVLDGDYRLIGEGLQQRDLALREQSNLGTWNSDRTDRMAVTQHRHRQDASIRHHLGETQDTIVAIRQHIRDLNDGAAQDCASRSRVLAGRSRKHSLKGFQPFRRETMTGAKAEKVV